MDRSKLIDVLFTDNGNFQSYSAEHWTILALGLATGIFIIKYAQNLSLPNQRLIGLWFSGVMCFMQLFRMVYTSYFGTFDPAIDLPFHLCNFLPFILFAMFYNQSKNIWKIVFIWVIAGTSQANFTPSNTESLPNIEAVRYWINHIGLVIMALYPAFVWGWRLTFKDIFLSLLWLNIAAAIVVPLNLISGGNYMYLMHKPAVKTAFDYMGPHPYYILTVELIFVALGLLVWLPFKATSSKG